MSTDPLVRGRKTEMHCTYGAGEVLHYIVYKRGISFVHFGLSMVIR
jgi:hypothetical protein